MIIDTTYLLPLARIDIDTDLLGAIAEGKVNLRLHEIGVSAISLFELQAKSASKSIPPKYVTAGVRAVVDAFKVEPFHSERVVEISLELMKVLRDYIDCIVVATAASLNEDLLTEDSRILSNKDFIERRYAVEVKRLADLIGGR